MHVLFVCTGNTCRSPMAEAYFRHICADPTITTSSAGVATHDGCPISSEALAALQQAGVPPASTVSTALTANLVAAAGCIITMTISHRDLIVTRFPGAAWKTQTLLSVVGQPADIPDPIGSPAAAYRRCLHSMQPALEQLYKQLTAPGR